MIQELKNQVRLQLENLKTDIAQKKPNEHPRAVIAYLEGCVDTYKKVIYIIEQVELDANIASHDS